GDQPPPGLRQGLPDAEPRLYSGGRAGHCRRARRSLERGCRQPGAQGGDRGSGPEKCRFAGHFAAFRPADPGREACLGSRSHSNPGPGFEHQTHPPRPVVPDRASLQDECRRPVPDALAGVCPEAPHEGGMSAALDAPQARAVKKKASGSSFYTAMRLMPKAEREAMFAIYAFCRKVDDIADDGIGTREERKVELVKWR